MKSSANNLFDAVIVAGGTSTRMGFDKLSALLGDVAVLSRAVRPFLSSPYIKNVIVVTDGKYDLPEKVTIAPAGRTRSQSVLSGLDKVTSPYVLIHDGARPFVTLSLIEKLCLETLKKGSAIPFIPVTDTLYKRSGPVLPCDREDYMLIQTPQAFETEKIKKAYELSGGQSQTDDSTLYTLSIGPCHFVEGDPSDKKITRPEDLFGANALVGTGFDLHRLVPGRKLRLCGVTLPYALGEEAHSDGDAPIHALMDAMLTALSLPDIGHLFPDTDPSYKDVDSTLLLKKVISIVKEKNRSLLSADIVILLEKPKVAPYISQMVSVLSQILELSPEKIGISATTTEKIGLIGDNQAVAALAVVSII